MNIRMKINKGRMNEKLDLIPYFGYLVDYAFSIHNTLHIYRKFLENYKSCLLKCNTLKFDKCLGNSALDCLFQFQRLCGQEHSKFAVEVGAFIDELKKWETNCEAIIKARDNLLKALSQKEKDKSRGNESPNDFEDAHCSHMDNLYKVLCLFYFNDQESQRIVREFQRQHVNFFRSCASHFGEDGRTGQNPSVSSRFFGAPLNNQLDNEGYSIVLRKTLGYLTASKAFTVEGIFRIAGQVSRVNMLRNAFEVEKVDERLLHFCGVHETADIVKQFLRELPDPIIPLALLQNWVSEATTSPSVDSIKSLLRKHVPELNRRNLYLILKFLSEVVEHHSTSKMDSTNLALTFWMNLYNKGNVNGPMSIVRCLIQNAKEILKDEKEATLFVSRSGTPRPAPSPNIPNNANISSQPPQRPPKPSVASSKSPPSDGLVTNFNSTEQHAKYDAPSVEVAGKSSPLSLASTETRSTMEKEESVENDVSSSSQPPMERSEAKNTSFEKESIESDHQEKPPAHKTSSEKELSSFTKSKSNSKTKLKETSESETADHESDSTSKSEEESKTTFSEKPSETERKKRERKIEKSKQSKNSSNCKDRHSSTRGNRKSREKESNQEP